MAHPTAKRHHYVPAFYLRGFAEDDRVTTVRLPGEHRYTAHVRRTAAENGFYSVPEAADGPDAFEKVLSGVEADASAVFQKLASGVWPLPLDDRAMLASFIALQAIRGPEHRRNMQYAQAQLARLEVSVVGKAGIRAWAKRKLNVDLDDAAAEELWEQATRPEGPPIRVSPLAHIRQMGELVNALVPYIAGRPWTLLEFSKRSLITSDAPVGLVRQPQDDDESFDGGVGFATAWGITYPLTRKLGLLMSDPMVLADHVHVSRVAGGDFDHREPGTTYYERFFNEYTAMNASEALFHHPDDTRFVPSDLPDPQPVTMRMSGGPLGSAV